MVLQAYTGISYVQTIGINKQIDQLLKKKFGLKFTKHQTFYVSLCAVRMAERSKAPDSR